MLERKLSDEQTKLRDFFWMRIHKNPGPVIVLSWFDDDLNINADELVTLSKTLDRPDASKIDFQQSELTQAHIAPLKAIILKHPKLTTVSLYCCSITDEMVWELLDPNDAAFIKRVPDVNFNFQLNNLTDAVFSRLPDCITPKTLDSILNQNRIYTQSTIQYYRSKAKRQEEEIPCLSRSAFFPAQEKSLWFRDDESIFTYLHNRLETDDLTLQKNLIIKINSILNTVMVSDNFFDLDEVGAIKSWETSEEDECVQQLAERIFSSQREFKIALIDKTKALLTPGIKEKLNLKSSCTP